MTYITLSRTDLYLTHFFFIYIHRQISTYDADFTLLPECDLTRALECLSQSFTISNNPLEDVGIEPSDLQSWEETFPMSPAEINSLQDALLLGATTTRGRQSSLMSMLDERHPLGCDGEDEARGEEGGDSGIGSEATSGPSSGLTSGHESHVLDTTTTHDLDTVLLSTLSLKESARVTRARQQQQPFQAHYTHKLHITSMEHGLMDQLAIRLLESIFFDNRQVVFPS